MPATISPFHQYAEEIGEFLFQERAREAERNRPKESNEGPSENTD